MLIAGPITRRAIAQAVISSARPGSPAAAIGVSGLGAEVLDDDLLDVAVRLVQVAQREQRLDPLARVSPIPIRIPEVNGIRSSPARRIIARRVAGRLSGACSWGPPGPQSRSETDSSIIPWLAETSRSSASSRRPRMPAFGWGSRPVRSRTIRHIAAR